MHVNDVVNAILKSLISEKARGQIINVASGKEITILKLISLISDEMGYNGKFDYEPPRKADLRRHKGDISLAKNLVNLEPKISFEEGIDSTVKWYRKILSEN